MKRLVVPVLVLLGACGGKSGVPRENQETPASNSTIPADNRAAPDEDRQALCAAFADRVVTCAFDESIRPQLSVEEKKSVRSIAYAVCTKTTDDPAALHYYGDVDRKIACMKDKNCLEVRVCLTRDDTGAAPAP